MSPIFGVWYKIAPAKTLMKPPQIGNPVTKPIEPSEKPNVNLRTNPFQIPKGEGSKTLKPAEKTNQKPNIIYIPKGKGQKPTEPLKTKPEDYKNQTRTQTTTNDSTKTKQT